jgi:uncharacterized protein
MARRLVHVGVMLGLISLWACDREQEGEPAAESLFCEHPAAAPAPVPRHPTSKRIERGLQVSLAGLALVGAGLVGWNERRRRHQGAAGRATDWAPYAAGAGLGATIAVSLVAFGHPVGVAGGIQQVAAGVATLGSRSAGALAGPGAGGSWPLLILVGLVAGGLLSRRLRHVRSSAAVAGPALTAPLGAARGRLPAWTGAFAAGVLLQIAALIAGGCTSGLALSGGIVLAPAAFLFMLGMFAGGIPAARFWRGS